MANPLQDARQELRLQAVIRSADRRRNLSPTEKLDIAADLIREAWSLHNAAQGTLARRRG